MVVGPYQVAAVGIAPLFRRLVQQMGEQADARMLIDNALRVLEGQVEERSLVVA